MPTLTECADLRSSKYGDTCIGLSGSHTISLVRSHGASSTKEGVVHAHDLFPLEENRQTIV